MYYVPYFYICISAFNFGVIFNLELRVLLPLFNVSANQHVLCKSKKLNLIERHRHQVGDSMVEICNVTGFVVL